MNRVCNNRTSNYKRILWLLAAVILIPFAACGKQPEKLSAPIDLLLTDRTLTWTAVEGASGYTIMIGDEEYVTDALSYEIEIEEAGRYEVKVKANGNGDTYSDSDWSDSLEFALI